MNITTATCILRRLLEGVDPETGEVLPEEHMVCEASVQEALSLAVQVLEAQSAAGYVPITRSGRLNAGRPWSQEDLDDLRRLYETGISIDEIARLTQRRPRGVRLQLNLMAGGGSRRSERVALPERLEPEVQGATTPLAAPSPDGPAGGYQPWEPDQDELLIRLRSEGWRVNEIAKTLARSTGAIRSRLKKLGLTDAEPTETIIPDRPWTEADTVELSRLAAQGLKAPDIANRLRRSVESVKGRLFYLGEDVSSPALFPPAESFARLPPTTSSRRWTEEDDAYLRQAWRDSVPIGEIAETLGRREYLVRCRLVYLDAADHAILGSSVPPEQAHQGLPWYPEEVARLQTLFRQGCSADRMAAALRRSEGAIRSRLALLGLAEDEP